MYCSLLNKTEDKYLFSWVIDISQPSGHCPTFCTHSLWCCTMLC